jgi:hypothetical protein
MLSKDDLADGTTFILKLRDAAGTPMQWVETFRGDLAARWFDIYRRSDWRALRASGARVFTHAVTEEAAERVRRARRCIVIKPALVRVEELSAATEVLAVRQ